MQQLPPLPLPFAVTRGSKASACRLRPCSHLLLQLAAARCVQYPNPARKPRPAQCTFPDTILFCDLVIQPTPPQSAGSPKPSLPCPAGLPTVLCQPNLTAGALLQTRPPAAAPGRRPCNHARLLHWQPLQHRHERGLMKRCAYHLLLAQGASTWYMEWWQGPPTYHQSYRHPALPAPSAPCAWRNPHRAGTSTWTASTGARSPSAAQVRQDSLQCKLPCRPAASSRPADAVLQVAVCAPACPLAHSLTHSLATAPLAPNRATRRRIQFHHLGG